METKLQQYFPMIKTRQELEHEIRHNQRLSDLFAMWNDEQKKEFLDFCTGVKGVKMLYDSFFKAILSPEIKPGRMEWLLSLILKQNVKILKVLPNESNRIADEGSLLIMDIVVQLADGSIANVECQKIGYAFPGQRAACYSADLLMRQYRRMKSEKGKKFSYRNIKKVYTIIFYETSSVEFKEHPENYIHRSCQTLDTGVKIDLLQEYVFITLDIFFAFHHNKDIQSELEAWLTFLGDDKPEDIIALIRQYPQFREMYQDVYEMCQNTEEVMNMFSKELQELDRNTVLYMIDEMQAEIDAKTSTISEQSTTISEQSTTISEQSTTISEQSTTIKEQNVTITEQKEQIAILEAELQKYKKVEKETIEERGDA